MGLHAEGHHQAEEHPRGQARAAVQLRGLHDALHVRLPLSPSHPRGPPPPPPPATRVETIAARARLATETGDRCAQAGPARPNFLKPAERGWCPESRGGRGLIVLNYFGHQFF
jgi:hypothetical protein